MFRRPTLPFLISLSLSWVGALYVLWVRNDVPGALTYSVLVPGALLIPLAFAKVRGQVHPRWLAPVYWIISAMVALNLLGTLWLHAHPFQYDRFLHFGIAFLALALASYTRAVFGYKSMTVFLILLAGLFIFEGYQWGSDRLIGTLLFTDNGQSMTRDVFEDALFGFLGLLAALPIAKRKLG